MHGVRLHALSALLWLAGIWTAVPAAGLPEAELAEFALEVQREASLPADFVERALADARRSEAVLAAIRKPAEAKPWHRYRPIFLTAERIEAGRRFLREHHASFAAEAGRSGVPAEVMCAIIGVETFYGRTTGAHRVLDALATLAFAHPPRATFFRSELKSFLWLTHEAGFAPGELQGSYAGAMGLPQFMPSSYRAYARDGDGDGRADIWRVPADAIASVGNYLGQHGWQRGAPVADRAVVAAAPATGLVAKRMDEPVRTVAQFGREGVRPEVDREPDRTALLVELAGVDGSEYWLGYRNFYAITRYNRSPLYAMAVHQLALAIAEEGTASAALRP